MKIIITENQLKDKVLQMVKTEGWKETCETLGLSGKELGEMFFNNNPMEFLNIYNDLDVVQSKENPDIFFFRYKPRHNLMIYDRKSRTVFIYKREIWTFLSEEFGLKYGEIQELTKTWLSEVYNLNGVKTWDLNI